MGTIATGLQDRQKDCYATSERVRLTLRTNGEERNSIITPQQTLVIAGFDAPETTPTGVVAAGGTLDGFYVYCYVYASTKYPYVENAVTADGELWPRSNPSPMSAVQDASAGTRKVTLTVATTSRTDIDKILIYRTQAQTTTEDAQALADAGTLYFIEVINNPGVDGTTTYIDEGDVDTGEALELDNYTPDTAQLCAFDGARWYAGGSPQFTASVTLDGTNEVTISGERWFDGRDGQIATFDGIAAGGFDSAGSWYLKITGTTTGETYADPDFATPLVVPYIGTTTIRVRGLTNILYRSKPFNPFSWGVTETVVAADGATSTQVPQSFALNLGGGVITAMSVSPNGKLLIIDFTNPQRTITLDLTQAESESFGDTQTILDNTGSVTCPFSQFDGMMGDRPVLFGYDSYNGNIIVRDGYQQRSVGDEFGDFLESLPKDDRIPLFIHGAYDPGTQLNCFWMRLYDTDERNNIMVWIHAPTGMCGWMPDFDVLCSATVLDDETGERFLVGGTENGFFGRLLAPDVYQNWVTPPSWFTVDNTTNVARFALLEWFSDIAIYPITQTSPSTGVFRVTTLNFGVQEIILFDAFTSLTPTEYTVQSILKISDSLWEVTLTTPYTEDGSGLFVAAHPRYLAGTWATVLNCSDPQPIQPLFTKAWFAKLTWAGFINPAPYEPVFDIDYSLEVGSETLDESSPFWPALDEPIVVMGGIPCSFRTYFDLETPTIDKKTYEFWITAKQVNEGDDPSARVVVYPCVRFFPQFSNDYTDSIALYRDVLPGETDSTTTSLAYYNKTQVPSTLLKSFGVEFMEVSMLDTEFFNFTIKVQES